MFPFKKKIRFEEGIDSLWGLSAEILGFYFKSCNLMKNAPSVKSLEDGYYSLESFDCGDSYDWHKLSNDDIYKRRNTIHSVAKGDHCGATWRIIIEKHTHEYLDEVTIDFIGTKKHKASLRISSTICEGYNRCELFINFDNKPSNVLFGDRDTFLNDRYIIYTSLNGKREFKTSHAFRIPKLKGVYKFPMFISIMKSVLLYIAFGYIHTTNKIETRPNTF